MGVSEDINFDEKFTVLNLENSGSDTLGSDAERRKEIMRELCMCT